MTYLKISGTRHEGPFLSPEFEALTKLVEFDKKMFAGHEFLENQIRMGMMT